MATYRIRNTETGESYLVDSPDYRATPNTAPFLRDKRNRKTRRAAKRHEDSRIANHVDGLDRDDLGESPDY